MLRSGAGIESSIMQCLSSHIVYYLNKPVSSLRSNLMIPVGNMMNTGDSTPLLMIIIGAIAICAIVGITIAIVKSRKRPTPKHARR